jgi:hypothetical protein
MTTATHEPIEATDRLEGCLGRRYPSVPAAIERELAGEAPLGPRILWHGDTDV